MKGEKENKYYLVLSHNSFDRFLRPIKQTAILLIDQLIFSLSAIERWRYLIYYYQI